MRVLLYTESKKIYSPQYIVSFLNSFCGRLQLKRLVIGSILEHITKEELLNVYILFPEDEKIKNGIIKKQKLAVEHRKKARENLADISGIFDKMFTYYSNPFGKTM